MDTGKIEVSGEEYAINEEFQQGALQLADELNVDELEAAKIFLEAQSEMDASERPVLTNAIIRFHQRRKTQLDCVRLVLQICVDVDKEESLRIDLQEFVSSVVRPEGTSPKYVQKCLSTMGDIRSWLQKLADKLNGASVLGQQQNPEFLETLEYERVSLVKQHESLGVIVLFLVKDNQSSVADFGLVLETLRKADRYDNLLGERSSNPAKTASSSLN
jgi:nuclear pore complex protein Nup205